METGTDRRVRFNRLISVFVVAASMVWRPYYFYVAFGFLHDYFGTGLLLVFLGLAISDPEEDFGLITMVVAGVVGFLNCIIHFLPIPRFSPFIPSTTSRDFVAGNLHLVGKSTHPEFFAAMPTESTCATTNESTCDVSSDSSATAIVKKSKSKAKSSKKAKPAPPAKKPSSKSSKKPSSKSSKKAKGAAPAKKASKKASKKAPAPSTASLTDNSDYSSS